MATKRKSTRNTLAKFQKKTGARAPVTKTVNSVRPPTKAVRKAPAFSVKRTNTKRK